MKRNKRFLGLVLALVILAGGYMLVNRLNATTDVSEETGEFALTEKTEDEIASIQWMDGENALKFAYADGTWTKADDASFPVAQDEMQGVAESVIALTAKQKFENVQNMADYGLEEPAFTLDVEYTDGSKATLAMGDATPFSDGYYVSDSAAPETVYVTETDLQDTFGLTEVDLAQLEEIPQIENVESLTIGSGISMICTEDGDSINPDQRWYDSADGYAVKNTEADKLADTIRGITWAKLQCVEATDEELVQWCLDEEQAVYVELTGDDTVLAMFIGTDAVNGDYYARLKDSRMVYTIAYDTANTLLSADGESMLAMDLMPVASENIAHVEYAAGESDWIFVCETVDDALSVTVNGTEYDAEAFGDLWTLTKKLTMTTNLTADEETDMLLTISAENTDGNSRTLEFYEYDAEKYFVKTSDGRSGLVAADNVDKLIRNLKQI